MQRKAKRMRRRRGEEGWTFVETLIVIAIILILITTVAFYAASAFGQARVTQAKIQIETFKVALISYAIDTGTFPTQEQGLKALHEKPDTAPLPKAWRKYLEQDVPLDPWGHDYLYFNPIPDEIAASGDSYGIRCLGADGKEGGEGDNADISTW
jgi:general secretion pathway protein G